MVQNPQDPVLDQDQLRRDNRPWIQLQFGLDMECLKLLWIPIELHQQRDGNLPFMVTLQQLVKSVMRCHLVSKQHKTQVSKLMEHVPILSFMAIKRDSALMMLSSYFLLLLHRLRYIICDEMKNNELHFSFLLFSQQTFCALWQWLGSRRSA